jgi:hypothetical protein
MTMQEPLLGGAVTAGGLHGTYLPPEHDLAGEAGGLRATRGRAVEPIVVRGSVAAQGSSGGAAPDPWPSWARAQLLEAVAVVGRVADRGGIAGLLYREWFNPKIDGVDGPRLRRPLAGIYRNAHAGSSLRTSRDGVLVIDRHDVIGADGWWRTWGESWTPPRTRPGSVRVLFTPRPDRLAEFVRTITTSLGGSTAPWTLACATHPRRVRRLAAAVLDVPMLDALPAPLLDDLAPLLLPVRPPLCQPIAAGAAVAAYPDNGMTFGEHRCHLIALALRHAGTDSDPLHAIATVFAAHGIDPATPHRAN